MKNIDYSSLPEHRAIVARDAAIVVREKARPSIQTRDGKFLTGTGDPLPPQVRIVKKASPIANRWRFSDGKNRDTSTSTSIRTSDTVISTVTPEEDAAWSKRMATMSGYDGGLQWRGDMAPVGKAVAQVADALRRVKGGARQKDALSKAVVAIANFGNTLGNSEAEFGPADALSFEGNDELTLADVHSANGISKAAVGDSGGAQLRAIRDRTSNEVEKIQRWHDDLWAKKPATNGTPAKLLESTSPARATKKSWWKG
jgi:hypothetical protein